MTAAAHVREVTTEEFEEAVLKESWRRPVVVDFWAAWCGPCRMLGPILESLAGEFGGDFLLAKVDSEANPELAQLFRIRSIPNVKVFKEGKIVDELVGAVPEQEARRFLRRHCPTPADRKFTDAVRLITAGRTDQARALLDEVLRLDSTHAEGLIELGRILAAEGDLSGAEGLWDRVPASSALWDRAQSLKQVAQFQAVCNAAGGPQAAAVRAAAEPGNLDARYAHGCCLVAAGEYRNALEEFLYVVSRNKDYRDQAARKAMLTLFALVGDRSELAEEFRSRLARVLF